MCDYFDQQKQLKLTNENKNDFKKSMVPIYESQTLADVLFQKHYLDNFNYSKTKENELNEKEYVNFWSDIYALFIC